MITATGMTVEIVETGERMKIKDPAIREFMFKIVNSMEDKKDREVIKTYESAKRDGINVMKARIENAMKGI